MRQPLPIVLLFLAACGSSDPKALTSEGYAALGKGDAKAALASFDEALPKLDPKTSEYYRAALGRCQALARIDPATARTTFLELAQELGKATVREDDYSYVCDALIQADAAKEAVLVMHAGMETFDKSEKMQQILATVKAAAERSPAARSALEGLGYT
jgi:tetratricopeptide (TPR) repeat protein